MSSPSHPHPPSSKRSGHHGAGAQGPDLPWAEMLLRTYLSPYKDRSSMMGDKIPSCCVRQAAGRSLLHLLASLVWGAWSPGLRALWTVMDRRLSRLRVCPGPADGRPRRIPASWGLFLLSSRNSCLSGLISPDMLGQGHGAG